MADDNKHAAIKMSTASKERKNLAYLQKMKDSGEKIVQMCPAELVFHGADSMLPMGVTNDTLKYMSDNYVPTYGHIGAISGWQTNATGYKRVGKTAEDAFKIFKWGYEYQENGMGGMTIELTPMEVSQAIADKLRVPVVSIAGGAACDGSEMMAKFEG